MILTTHRPRRRAAAALAALAFVPMAGCGSDDSSSGGSAKGPAASLPAASLVYFDLNLNGPSRTDLDQLVAKFAPGKTIDSLIEQAGKSDRTATADYLKDVKPILGDKVGIALTGLRGSTPDYAAVIDVTDEGKAKDLIAKDSTAAGDYKGIALRRDNTDKTQLAGVTDGEIVIGTQAGLDQAVDTIKGGASLASVGQFQSLQKAAGSGNAFVYGDVDKLLALAGQTQQTAEDQAGLDAVREFATKSGVTTFGATITTKADRVAVTAVTTAKAQPGEGQAATAVSTLPGGSLAAFGIGDLGGSLTQLLDGVRSIKTTTAGISPGAEIDQGLAKIQAATGLDVQKDLLAWMGSAGLFVRGGTSIADIGGALVVQSKDKAATAAALDKIEPLAKASGVAPTALSGNGVDKGFALTLPTLPVKVFVALAGDKFIIAANQQALTDAIKPSSTLADDPALKAAGAQLGNGIQPSAFIDFSSIGALVGLAAGSSPQYQMAKPYLDRITTIAAGSKRDGNLLKQEFLVGIR